MEKRDAVVLLLLLGGGYAVYANWDTIAAKLDLDELDPRTIKAIDLAQKDSSFERNVANRLFLESRRVSGEIELAADPWQAEAIGGQDYRVTVRWVEGGEPVVHGFSVNIATRTVVYDGLVDEAAAPR